MLLPRQMRFEMNSDNNLQAYTDICSICLICVQIRGSIYGDSDARLQPEGFTKVVSAFTVDFRRFFIIVVSLWSESLRKNRSEEHTTQLFLNPLDSKMCFQVTVQHLSGNRVVDVCQTKEQLKNVTVSDLKKKIIQEYGSVEDFRLVFRTILLEDQVTLESLESAGLKHMSTIQTLPRLRGGSS